jgi:hypothetical protein
VIHRRTSSARQAVIPADSFTGLGNERARTCRHSVDFEIGTNASTCRWRRKPVSGKQGEGLVAAPDSVACKGLAAAALPDIEVRMGMIDLLGGRLRRKA